jgi:hypothetical protein
MTESYQGAGAYRVYRLVEQLVFGDKVDSQILG